MLPPRPPRPTPSSANATGASSNATANSRPWSRSPAPSWSSSGSYSPTPPPDSTTWDPTITTAASTLNAGCATTSPNSPPWATGSPSNPPPSTPNTHRRNLTWRQAPPGAFVLPTHLGYFSDQESWSWRITRRSGGTRASLLTQFGVPV